MSVKDKLLRDEKKNLLLFPLLLVEIYLTGVILLYVLGPWDWPTHRPALFFLMIFLYQLFFFIGYLFAINKKNSNLVNLETSKNYRNSITKFLYIMIIINFIYVILNFFQTVGLSSFSFINIINAFSNGLLNPSEQYLMKFSVAPDNSIFNYLSVLFAPIVWPVFPLSFYNFKELNIIYKFIVIVSLFFELGRWIATGTSKGIIDIMVILLVIIVIRYMQNKIDNKRSRIKFNIKKYKFPIIIISLLVLGLLFFSNNVEDRVNQNWNNYSYSNGNVRIDHESPLMKMTPNSLKPTLIYLTSYLTQGYYAFSLALDLDFHPMFGVGNSMFLMENLNEIFSWNLYENTYQSRMNIYGWEPYANWHSFYVWASNDVHYVGVVLIMFFMGYLFGSTYKKSLFERDPVSISLLCLISIMIMYLPANNQLLSYPTTFMAFWVLLFYWILRKKYKFVLSSSRNSKSVV